MRAALRPILLNSVPGWVRSNYGLLVPSVVTHYDEGRAWVQGFGTVDPTSLITTTRASTGYAQWADGHLSSFAANIPRITDLGLLVEQAATNVVLWNRDLTNAAWTKSNITAALNQTGADGTANAATSLTATGANGTCLQAITLASSARFQSAFVKRLTGTGTINMTMDNGATWTAITVTAAYTQLTIPTQTLANPTVGFRIVTSGDAIAVDLVGNENGTFATSPIATTTVAVTRAADSVTQALAGYSIGGVVISAKAPAVLNGQTQTVWEWDDGTANNRIMLYSNTGGTLSLLVVTGGVTQVPDIAIGSLTVNTAFKVALRWRAASFGASLNGAAEVTQSSGTIPTITTLRYGAYSGGAPWNSLIKRVSLFKTNSINTVALSQ